MKKEVKLYTSSYDGKTYYEIADDNGNYGHGAYHLFSTDIFTEASALREFERRKDFEQMRSLVRKWASLTLPDDFYERRKDFVYLFMEQEAWGDRLYYYDSKKGGFVSDWYSIGD